MVKEQFKKIVKVGFYSLIGIILFIVFLYADYPYDFFMIWTVVLIYFATHVTHTRKEDKNNIEDILINNQIIQDNKEAMNGGTTPGFLFYTQMVEPDEDISLKKTKKPR